MGYCIDVECYDVVIKKENIEKALDAINSIPMGHYSWVDHSGNFKNIINAFREWRYEAEITDDNLTIKYFCGEKLGEDNTLWEAIAPYVEKDAFVEYHGEDGCQWRIVFDGKSMRELTRSNEWI